MQEPRQVDTSITVWRHIVKRFVGLLGVLIGLNGCNFYSDQHRGFSQMEEIRHKGVLTVLTRQDPTTYYEGPEGPTGLEYDLVRLFAERIGVKVRFVFPETFADLLGQIADGKADIAAAGLTVTPGREQQMRFAPPYQTVTEQVIYRTGNPAPETVADLNKGIVEVVKGTTHISTLTQLLDDNRDLQWNVNEELDTDGLLFLVNEGLIDYTIADSQQVAMISRFYPNLAVAFDISAPRQLAWALPASSDDSVYNEIAAFFEEIRREKTLQQLLEKHYGYAGNLNYVGNCTFRQHIRTRLPKFQMLFQTAAAEQQLDWRLLAALSYQESHWENDNTSPTGVEGLMMLTQNTAEQLGVKNRNDPKQSVRGGAVYLKQRLAETPADIPEPDRTWFALAAYNVGLGHVEDARILTRKQKGNPNKWLDVKNVLPLLSRPQWYGQTKHGYARGGEPVRFVENIRSYYNLLVWLTSDNAIERNVMDVESPADSEVAAQ